MFKVICITGVNTTRLAPGTILLEQDVIFVGQEYTVDEIEQNFFCEQMYVLKERSPFNLYNANLFAVCDSKIDESLKVIHESKS